MRLFFSIYILLILGQSFAQKNDRQINGRFLIEEQQNNHSFMLILENESTHEIRITHSKSIEPNDLYQNFSFNHLSTGKYTLFIPQQSFYGAVKYENITIGNSKIQPIQFNITKEYTHIVEKDIIEEDTIWYYINGPIIRSKKIPCSPNIISTYSPSLTLKGTAASYEYYQKPSHE